MFKDYIKLIRVKHYIKNTIIFFPLFFGKGLFNLEGIKGAFAGFICMCLMSSAIYIFNDLRDVEKDKKHQTKKNRPIASGRIKKTNAFILMGVCFAMAVFLSYYLLDIRSFMCLIAYAMINVLYSLGLKNIQIIDITILAAGYVIRIILGGIITGVVISRWLYLVVVAGSLYMGLGKRRNELKNQSGTREVLAHYNISFLDKNMYVCVALANVFYALWTLEMDDIWITWTVPAFILLLMRYSWDVERDSDGDPIEVILSDKVLIIMIVSYSLVMFMFLYFV